MNGAIRRLSVFTLLMFLVLFGSLTWVQFVQAPELNADQRNSRTIIRSYNTDRGPIISGDRAIAESKQDGTEAGNSKDPLFTRTYPDPQIYAPITGFYSFTYGATQLESVLNNDLAGASKGQLFQRMQNLASRNGEKGDSVELTINPAAQQAAWDALGDQRGAVVALDPKTGNVLAMVSKPSFDPNTLVGYDSAAVKASYDQLVADPQSPLHNRTTETLYAPGSTFKLITAAAALQSGKYNPDSLLAGPAELQLGDTSSTMSNFPYGACGPNDQVTLREAIRISCNTAFSSLGRDLGADEIRKQAEAFGFGRSFDVPLQTATSSYPAELTEVQTMLSAIGQFDVRETPLQIAMVSQAIANGGELMKPNMVKSIKRPDLSVVAEPQPEKIGNPISPETATALKEMMIPVVDSGTGTAAQIQGVQIAAKTGTAEQGEGNLNDLLFTGFAPAEDPKVVVAVVVEDGGIRGQVATGGSDAAPIARSVIEAVLNS